MRALEISEEIATTLRMPIYEYYCADNHTIYQFYAKSLAQGKTVPRCPDNPSFKLVKMLSSFAVKTGGKKDDAENASDSPAGANPAEDAKLEAAMGAMEREFASVDENDPRAMGRMMRRMAELTGEKIDGEMEEVVRKLEEGADPDALEEQLGDAFPDEANPGNPYGEAPQGTAEVDDTAAKKMRYQVRRASPRRDPKLYDYE